MSYDFETAIANLITAIKTDYYDWTMRSSKGNLSEINKKMIAEFNTGITVESGRKYLKIVKDGSVWGFIVKSDEGKFRAGDILKPASWATPAKNSARGNIFGTYQINWTGPNYLR